MDENLIYKYNQPLFPKFNRKISEITNKLAKITAILGLILVAIGFAPSIWYAIAPKKLDISRLLATTFKQDSESKFSAPEIKKEEQIIYQPRLDQNLPRENSINIPAVKIETSINEAPYSSFEEALKIGVWRVPDFGTPFARKLPTILAAHRYGYLKWSVPYRLKNSFYKLPRVKVGDTVEITWDQRKYVYEVYAESEGEEITDYNANLILYTCKDLDTPVRVFKYARLLEI